MKAAQPAKNWLSVPRARDSWEPARRVMKTPVATISRIALRSSAKTARNGSSEFSDQLGQASCRRKKSHALCTAWRFDQSV
jgi:hypothetical protein